MKCEQCGCTKSVTCVNPYGIQVDTFTCVECGGEMYPQQLSFTFDCPDCAKPITALLVNDGEKIMQQAVSCDCGWSKEEIEVTDLVFMEGEN